VRGEALRDICKALTQAGNIEDNIERAIDVATSILMASMIKGMRFGIFPIALTQAGNIEGNFDRAIAVATSIPE
jgi:hypothetical protein